jgi:hypothetical protein
MEGSCKSSFLGSQLLLFELSLPVVSLQFRPLAAMVAASGGFKNRLGVSGADLIAARGG